ncbi:hypothetical protein IFM89_001760 [Coptis chinensis]|uniref:DUF7036 domain-containing protein n=1 Tax=Coptis chinensis TaxID=261450 RepID=A0A835LQG7_9MAGN|nr:hypothetical protein IFM89_001760 [Coptis chinensis]
MGKIYQTQEQLQQERNNQAQAQTSSSREFGCCGCFPNGFIRIKKSFSFKCLFILILSVSLFLSAIFWIPPFNRLASQFDAHAADKLNVTVKASFTLQKPVSLVLAHKDILEDDILEEIGVPNTKVSLLSMHQAATSNWSDVVFGVLPDPNNVPINLVSLSVLKSSLVELFLRQLNLSLTTSIFGKPSSFEILKFSGGITVVPGPTASVFKAPQVLFNFTLNNSISEIQESFYEFKEELKFGLRLRPYEVITLVLMVFQTGYMIYIILVASDVSRFNFPIWLQHIYVQLTNGNGSTVDPPVTVQASVISDIGSHSLLPQRLKQLAQTITKSPPSKNLGLDHSVFGKVKGISLSSILNRTLVHPSPGGPTPSPSPSPSLSLSPSPSQPPSPSEGIHHSAPLISPTPAPAPAPSGGHQGLSPCSHCGASFSHAPVPAFVPQPVSPPNSESPAPSMLTHPPRQIPCRRPSVAPSPVPTSYSERSAPPSFPPHAISPLPLGRMPKVAPDFPPTPAASHGTSPNHDGKVKPPVSPEQASSPISPSSSSSLPDPNCRGMWLIGMLVAWLFHFLNEPF